MIEKDLCYDSNSRFTIACDIGRVWSSAFRRLLLADRLKPELRTAKMRITGVMKLKRFNSREFRKWSFILQWFLLLLVVGCGEGRAKKSTESDANGYISKNGYKFYTDRDVFADKCPKTGELEIFEVCAYAKEDWRPGNTNYVIAPRGAPFKAPDGTIYNRIFLP